MAPSLLPQTSTTTMFIPCENSEQSSTASTVDWSLPAASFTVSRLSTAEISEMPLSQGQHSPPGVNASVLC